MVINADLGLLPQGEFIRSNRQGFECRFIYQIEQFLAAFSQMLHLAMIEVFQQFTDCFIQFEQTEKPVVA